MALDYVALVFFLLTAFIVISVVVFQPAFRIGSLFKGKKVTVPYYIFPLLAVLILLIAGKFSWHTVSDGLLGDDDIQPLAIVCIFMTLAYICIALDHTGFFHYISYAMLRAAGDSGSRLYLYSYILTALLTVLTDNDVVVLTLTPILIYFTSKTENVGPIPFVTTEFYVAQVAGAARLIGNPATIIVSQAQGLDFVSYMRWMMLPVVCALIFMYFELNAMFWYQMPKKIKMKGQHKQVGYNSQDSSESIETESLNLVYCGCINTIECSAIMKDDLDDVSAPIMKDTLVIEDENDINMAFRDVKDPPGAAIVAVVLILCMVALSVCKIIGIELWHVTLAFAVFTFIYVLVAYEIVPRYQQSKKGLSSSLCNPPNTEHGLRAWDAFLDMPWGVVPFVLGMFILVQGLNEDGWIDEFGSYFVNFVGSSKGGMMETVPLTFAILGITTVSTNFINNQPAAILFSRILLSSKFVEATTHKQQLGSGFAVIIATNFGANLTLIGALGGIIWTNILTQKKVLCSGKKFSAIGTTVTVIPICIAMFVVNLELWYT